MGRCYLEGAGVPPSRTEGARWLERAANQGYVEAQAQLATLAIHGLTASCGHGDLAARLFAPTAATAPDFETGLRWARKAADRRLRRWPGGARLHPDLRTGDDARPRRSASLVRAFGRCRLPAGRSRLCAVAGTHGDRRQEQQAQVAENLRRAADAGLPTALYLLGVMTERGVAMPADRAAAIQLFRQAAEKGNRPSQARWGMALMQGLTVPANPVEGESWLRRAALAGDPEAAAVVGDLYAKGGKLPPNYAEAAMWFRRAAEAGHRGAARALWACCI